LKKALICGVNLNQNDFTYYWQEFKALVVSGGYEIIGELIQKSKSVDPRFCFRKGKVEECKSLINEECTLIFYNRLTFAMLRNLNEELGLDVIDRTQLILDIFSYRANSKQAQLQIEMARLNYAMSESNEDRGSDDSSGGTLHNKGSGESRSALIARKNKKRINELSKELNKLSLKQQQTSKRREKSGLKKVALVGYTNAGKSSLMNALLTSEKSVYAKDQLFATLDTTTRQIEYKNYRFLLFDTVGFVSDLPHELIEAFNSTLMAVKEADLLLIVSDSSNPYNQQQFDISLQTLKKINADDIPYLHIYNKIDLLKEKPNYKYGISALTKEGIDNLLEAIVNSLYPQEIEKEIFIPYAAYSLIDDFKTITKIKLVQEKEEGALYLISGSKENINALIKRIQDFS